MIQEIENLQRFLCIIAGTGYYKEEVSEYYATRI